MTGPCSKEVACPKVNKGSDVSSIAMGVSVEIELL